MITREKAIEIAEQWHDGSHVYAFCSTHGRVQSEYNRQEILKSLGDSLVWAKADDPDNQQDIQDLQDLREYVVAQPILAEDDEFCQREIQKNHLWWEKLMREQVVSE